MKPSQMKFGGLAALAICATTLTVSSAIAGDESHREVVSKNGGAPPSAVPAFVSAEGRSQTPTQVIPAEQARAFGILRSSQQADAKTQARAPATEVFGANPTLTRWIDTSAGRVRVTPGTTGICIGLEAGPVYGSSCASTEDALAGRLIVASRDESGRGTAVGLLPDGVATVSLAAGNRSADARVPVEDNIWIATDSDAKVATFGSAGSATTSAAGHAAAAPLTEVTIP